MRWILSNIPLLAFLFIVFSIVRAIRRAQQLSQEHKADGGETEEQRRVREIQERIRRIAAERRGQRVPVALPPVVQSAEPVPAFGGTMRRVLAELERRIETHIPTPASQATIGAEMERQEQLAEQLRVLEEARTNAERRAKEVAAGKLEDARSESAILRATRNQVLEDLKDPQGLRRAFLLREVLGTPVGLR
jgi:hypothetical protein